ncbi:MAG: flagellar filament capping protein FliD [Rhizobacter sp.]
MSTISSPGIGSGLDVQSIVTQLVALERKPIDDLQTKAATIQTQLSSFGLLQSYTTNLRDIADRLSKSDFWTAATASSSDPLSVSATAAVGAAAGSYSIEVSKLAKAQSLASQPYAASGTVVGTGTLHIQVGTWNDPPTVFTADGSKPMVDVTIGAADNTLDKIKAKINAANAGVTAAIVHDANGYRLSLRSNTTGAASAVRIDVTDGDGANTDASGLSALAFDPAVAASPTIQTQAAQNAQATINGLAVTSASNTLDGVVDGVTLTLAKETTAPVDVRVALDTASLKKGIADFAKAFSDMNTYISAQTKYDAATKKAAALQGDRPTLSVQSSLRNVFLDASSASASFARLSDIGLSLQTDGTLKVNDTKLAAALANPNEVARLFSSTTSSDPNEQGFAVRVKSLASQLIASGGAITTHTKALRDSIARNSAQQTRLEQRVAAMQERLTKQYAGLDTTIAQTKSVNSTLTQSLAMLQAQSESIAKNG